MPSFLDIFRNYLPTWNEIRNKPSTFAAAAHKATHQSGGTDEISLSGLSIDAHAAAHQNGGTDEISVAALSGTLADEQDAGAIKGVAIDDTAIGDQKTLAYDLASETIIYITPAPSGAAIISLQSGLTYVGPASTSETTELTTEVDLTKAVVFHNGTSGGGSYPKDSLFSVRLSDSTHVIAERIGNDGPANTNWTVVEFSNLTSLQNKICTIPAGSTVGDESHTAVNLSKATLVYRGSRTDYASTTGVYGRCQARFWFTDTETVRAHRTSNTPNVYVEYAIVEFP